jgi:hypothetical protein
MFTYPFLSTNIENKTNVVAESNDFHVFKRLKSTSNEFKTCTFAPYYSNHVALTSASSNLNLSNIA